MNQQLTSDQLDRLIAEVEHLSQRREAELNREQVREIFQELNLPIDLLDDALMQLRRREALVVQQKRRRRITFGVGVTLMTIAIASSLWFNHRQNTIAKVYANSNQSRITLTRLDKTDDLTVVNRQENPLIYYQVKLQQAPVGRQLSLKCNWINPLGQIEHQNNYSTRSIDREVWNTRCRHQFGDASPVGNWRVQMLLNGRILSETEFIVR
ncbi:hypothetical protein ACL6C3_15040 [Capilliphycus salinus ALCB114379]|uniref:hypothetical protein n=1 Tax=Capilliphycus salinus TaxID=2768948 RepID=UPI0039A6F674